MFSSVRVVPTLANRIRAAAAADPKATHRQLAGRLGIHWQQVDIALSKGDTRRIKSVAP